MRSARIGLRATAEQEAILLRAANASHKSLTEFILDSACLAAETTLLEQRLFWVSEAQSNALQELLDCPEKDNSGLLDLFVKPSPWDVEKR